MKSALEIILESFRNAAQTEREKGTYFEELILTYLRNEPYYKELYEQVMTYADWAKSQNLSKHDTGIDLVALTKGTEEVHAIQCKFYEKTAKLSKKDIDSFLSASGKAPFKQRLIVSTTEHWGEHAEDTIRGQHIPVSLTDIHGLETSQIDWSKYQPNKPPAMKPKKELLEHQKIALNNVKKSLGTADRGKLIMACGTGKTFTSLKIAEELAGAGKRVLFLVPSLSLLSQTLTEWTQESKVPLYSFAVCSDSDVGKKRKKDDDVIQTHLHELRYPATTKPESLAKAMAQRYDNDHMSVVFSTYHSIDVLGQAQRDYQLSEFDLIICDEAHRTTGSTLTGEDDSSFVKIHKNENVRGKKRLYMTATPRIYSAAAQATAEKDNIELYPMDSEKYFGKTLHVLNFSEAVERDLLVDYKVIVLAIDEIHISARLQKLLADENNSLKVDDAAKIVGCWKALSKQGQSEDSFVGDEFPMKKAVAFCQVIEEQPGARTHKVSSKKIAQMFQAVVEAYKAQEEDPNSLICEADHIDGSMNASEKEGKLEWLKEETSNETCRVLSNVRCLSEGVDVPALDAVLFLTPRNSQVDVVQSVGRIMRKSPDKKRGYVILPVVIPAGMTPDQALDDNRTYKVVWEVLQALRSHDDRFDAMINRLDINGNEPQKMEVIAITDNVSTSRKKKETKKDQAKTQARSSYNFGSAENVKGEIGKQMPIHFEMGEIERALYAKVVKKCGNRTHWETWATDIAKIAQTHIARITAIINTPSNTKEIEAFKDFANELRDDLNDDITNEEVVEMLAQHIVTKPVFEALFEEYSFTNQNPVSQAMQKILEQLAVHRLDKETDTLDQFYRSVKLRASGINNAQGKQKIVVELYDKFFRNAFPRLTERLGIVYTPVEVVDFIIHSVDHILQSEFNQTLGSKGVHIIDPFTGTGTFITRMLQSGLIKPEELPLKYKTEIHANEIVLLAYYIAAVNIEAVYHSLAGGEYVPFEGICLTDTFQLYEKDDLVSQLMTDNSDRRKRQKGLDIRVIMGNPPYSKGQTSANDSNANTSYPCLDESIRSTYAYHSKLINKNALYNSYVRAIRWGSDRLGKDGGIMAYVSSAGWFDNIAMDGFRHCLESEFSSIYIFHLRGNQRTQGELSRKEGGKIFGSGSRSPIAITFFIKNPQSPKKGQIYFHDIGDYLSQEKKFQIIQDFHSIQGISEINGWKILIPDEHNDWLNHRDVLFDTFIPIGDKATKKEEGAIFTTYSRGLATSRDAWAYNFSQTALISNMNSMVDFYNTQVNSFAQKYKNTSFKTIEDRKRVVEDFIDNDPTKISWSRGLKDDLSRFINHTYKPEGLRHGIYRPFCKQWVYFDKDFNDMIYQLPKIFPEAGIENRVMCLTGVGSKAFSIIISDMLPCLDMIEKGQCFPLKLYTKAALETDMPLFQEQRTPEQGYKIRHGITDEGLQHFQAAYQNISSSERITKDDIFYYVYGLLHSPEYRERYADNLSKQLSRIPCVKKIADFWYFSEAGRELAELHINYDFIEPYPITVEQYNSIPLTNEERYRVEKMKLGKNNNEKDLSTVIYNQYITVKNIPIRAYDYIVNGKSAIDWVIDRQIVKPDTDSGILKDANRYAIETVGDPAYPLKLLQRVITVSLRTLEIIENLPVLEIDIKHGDTTKALIDTFTK